MTQPLSFYNIFQNIPDQELINAQLENSIYLHNICFLLSMDIQVSEENKNKFNVN
jgi:hypothetical protein